MPQHEVLVIGLDGLDIGYCEQLFESGDLPALAALRDRSKRFLLDHGAAARTGLAWEHFATGMTPERAQRASMIALVGTEYDTRQRGTRFAPFFSSFDARVVVFDPPYTDLSRAPAVRGVVAWGAHDPGVASTSSPPELRRELNARVGRYPSGKWTYVSPWPSARLTAEMGAALVRGLGARREAARWLLAERIADWDLAIVVAGEPHSAAEAFWHGIDPTHPLHGHPSAAAAAQSLADVYRETDRLVGDLIAATQPRSVLVFSMGGMGANNSDTPSMVLLPELVYRWATGNTLLDVPREWADDPSRVPIIPEGQTWSAALSTCYPATPRPFSRLRARVPDRARQFAKRMLAALGTPSATISTEWIPASRYRSHWATMRAFALPSMYDGRIRVNLRGRETAGIVDPADHAGVCAELEDLLRDCRDPRTGEPVVDHFERPDSSDPLALDSEEADLTVAWRDPACAFVHPTLGLVGPAPFRRTGGHTGPYGFAYVSGEGIDIGDGGIRSAFDVSPTIAMMLDLPRPSGLDGTSMFAARV